MAFGEPEVSCSLAFNWRWVVLSWRLGLLPSRPLIWILPGDVPSWLRVPCRLWRPWFVLGCESTPSTQRPGGAQQTREAPPGRHKHMSSFDPDIGPPCFDVWRIVRHFNWRGRDCLPGRVHGSTFALRLSVDTEDSFGRPNHRAKCR